MGFHSVDTGIDTTVISASGFDRIFPRLLPKGEADSALSGPLQLL